MRQPDLQLGSSRNDRNVRSAVLVGGEKRVAEEAAQPEAEALSRLSRTCSRPRASARTTVRGAVDPRGPEARADRRAVDVEARRLRAGGGGGRRSTATAVGGASLNMAGGGCRLSGGGVPSRRQSTCGGRQHRRSPAVPFRSPAGGAVVVRRRRSSYVAGGGAAGVQLLLQLRDLLSPPRPGCAPWASSAGNPCRRRSPSRRPASAGSLRDVVEEPRIRLLVVALLPGLDRLVELPEVVILRPLLKQLARLLGVLRLRRRRREGSAAKAAITTTATAPREATIGSGYAGR